jgi:hypothetical protein
LAAGRSCRRIPPPPGAAFWLRRRIGSSVAAPAPLRGPCTPSCTPWHARPGPESAAGATRGLTGAMMRLPAQVLESRVDHTRVVGILRKADNLPLIKDYLLSVQKSNLLAVNEAVNELLIEEEDFEVN